jgi:putative membrane protein
MVTKSNSKASFFVRQIKYVKMFFAIFYSVGIAGIAFPYSREFFLMLIPFAILLSLNGVLFFYEGKVNSKSILVLLTIYFLGFFVEVIGVNTGYIFGNYSYGQGLGIKLFSTPLLIGLNWAFLVYCTASIVDQIKTPTIIKIIAASGLMVIYDIVLEQIAPKIDMWKWENSTIPIQNYISWFLIAIVFHTLVKISKIKLKNKMAALIFIYQAAFFIILLLFFNLKK